MFVIAIIVVLISFKSGNLLQTVCGLLIAILGSLMEILSILEGWVK